MKGRRARKKVLEYLRETGIVQLACEKAGISRQTFYRWKQEDSIFEKAAQDAIDTGVSRINDIAVSNVVRGISQHDKDYTKYWLNHRHPEFRKVSPYEESLLKKPEIVRFDPEKYKEAQGLFESLGMHSMNSTAKDVSEPFTIQIDKEDDLQVSIQ